MDLRQRATATLARASARDGRIITPDNATSPMDAEDTARIAGAVIAEADARGRAARDGVGSSMHLEGVLPNQIPMSQIPTGQVPTARKPTGQ